MQVVDFPHLSTLRVFWRGEITAEAQRRRGGEKDGVQTEIAVVGVEKGGLEGGWRRVLAKKWLCSITRIYTHLQRFYTRFLRTTKFGADPQDLLIRKGDTRRRKTAP